MAICSRKAPPKYFPIFVVVRAGIFSLSLLRKNRDASFSGYYSYRNAAARTRMGLSVALRHVFTTSVQKMRKTLKNDDFITLFLPPARGKF